MENRKQYIAELLQRYRTGTTSGEDDLMIENLLERGEIEFEQLAGLSELDEKIMRMESPQTSASLDERFYAMLAAEKRRSVNPFREMFSFQGWIPRLAFSAVVFFFGLALGYLLFKDKATPTAEMAALSNEVKGLREMMMLSLLEKESATDRLKAVSLSQEMEESSATVINALVKTLNNDENVNVRLAALDALKAYAHLSDVRTELIRSISQQQSPLVQIALAELMASLQVKSSVKEFDKLLKDERTPQEVKKRIRKSIEVLS